MSSVPNAQDYYELQTIALEFLVRRGLDGTTPSPPFFLPPDPRANTNVDTGCVRIEVDELGLVDLSGGGGDGTRADRIVRAILIAGPVPIPVTPGLVARAFDGITDPQGQLAIPVGAVGIDSSNCIFVPATGQLQLDGMTALPGTPILVRICVWEARTVEEMGEQIQVCCCRASVLDEEGNPFYTQALYPTDTCTRTVTDVDPGNVAVGAGDTAVNIGGTGFAEGDIVYFISQDGGPNLTVVSNVFVSSVQIQVVINVPVTATVGSYTVIVAPPLSPVQCQGVLEDGFVVDLA